MDHRNSFQLFVVISQQRIYAHYMPKLIATLKIIADHELWIQEHPNMNSIGAITLHICEHINRNSLRLSNKEAITFQEGIEHYFPNLNCSVQALVKVVDESFNRLNVVIQQLLDENSDTILTHIDMHDLYHLVEHTGYHIGQIVDRAKQITGESFNFCQNGINEKTLRETVKIRLRKLS